MSDDDWVLAAPYLTLKRADEPQRLLDLREGSQDSRWLVRRGARWRQLRHDFPRWEAVYQQTRPWIAAGCREAMARFRRLARNH